MNILVDVGHPAHVHFYKNFIREMEKKGHNLIVTEREKQCTKDLLNYNYIKYITLVGHIGKAHALFQKFLINTVRTKKLYKLMKRYRIEIGLGVSDYPVAWAGRLINCKSIIFTDSEPVKIDKFFTYPFSHVIITPQHFNKKIQLEKHIRINSFKELAYLHPIWFKPKSDILKILNLLKSDNYVILRFNAFGAGHDIGMKGFSLDHKRNLVKKLEKYAHVFISSELQLPIDLEPYIIKIPPHKMHDALYYANLLVCDTQTSTTEAACLGTPAIRSNNWVGPKDMSNFIELEQKYKLIFNIGDPNKAIEKAVELIKKPDIKQEWKKKRKKLLEDKIDLTSFMIWFIENYPESHQIMKENPNYQDKFK
jgi:predicted glycosyltransferase